MLKNRLKKLLLISITAVLLYGCYSLYAQTRAESPIRYAQVVVESPFENVQTNTDIINTYFQEKVIVVKRKMYCDGVLLWETDYDRAGEEIKAVRYKSDGSIDKWEEYERREDGKKSAWICYRGDGSISSSGECKYDEAGNEIENVEYNHSGDITVKSTYVYDEAGNEIEHVQYFGDDIYRRYEYEYEEDGRKKKCIEYNGDGDIFSYKECEYDEAGHVTKEEYHDFAERIEYYYTYQYRYNEAGDIEKKICYDEDGSISYWYEYQYDEAGHELSELTYGTDGIYRRSEQKYDKNGNEIRVTYIVDGEVTMQLEFSRDEWGNVTEERGRSLGKEWEANIYEYEYETVYVPSRQYTQVVVANKKEYHDGTLAAETEYDKAGNKIKHTWYNSDGSIDTWKEYQYDTNGKMIKEVRYDGDGSIYVQNKYTYDNVGNLIVYESASDDHNRKETYEYDEAGDMIKFVEYFDDDLYRRTEYEYDAAGRLKSDTVYNADGDMCGGEVHEYEYDEEGNVTSDVTSGFYNPNMDINIRQVFYSDECQYDKAGNMVKEIHYITDDMYYLSEWEYDEKGRLLTEIKCFDDGITVHTKDEYEYDSAGKRIKRIRTEYGETEEEITDFYYDEWGNLIEEKTGEKSITYEYEYEFVYTKNAKAKQNVEKEEEVTALDKKTPKEQAVIAYRQFIDGRCSAGGVNIYELAMPTGEPDRRYPTDYAIIDVNGDGMPELNIKTARELTVISFEDGELRVFKYIEPGSVWSVSLLNNGAFMYFSDRFSACSYSYFELDESGNKINGLGFYWDENNGNYIPDEFDDFFFDDNACSMEEWYDKTREYLYTDENGREQIRNQVEWTRYCEADPFETNGQVHYEREYQLTLYDKEHNEILSESYPESMWIDSVSEDVLEIGISVGNSSNNVYYFNKETAQISDTFYNAIVVEDKYIAYMEDDASEKEERILILSDIFKEGILYQEITRDFSKTAEPMSAIISIEMIDDETIGLEYYQGENYAIEYETISIGDYIVLELKQAEERE